MIKDIGPSIARAAPIRFSWSTTAPMDSTYYVASSSPFHSYYMSLVTLRVETIHTLLEHLTSVAVPLLPLIGRVGMDGVIFVEIHSGWVAGLSLVKCQGFIDRGNQST